MNADVRLSETLKIRKLFVGILNSIQNIAKCSMLVLLLVSASGSIEAADQSGKIYSGGEIITMDPSRPRVESLLVREGRILALGTRNEMLGLAGEKPDEVDLRGMTLLPGFIDAHGHFGAVISFQRFENLASPPVGEIRTIEDLVAQLRRAKLCVPEGEIPEEAQVCVPEGEWILGAGYDDALLTEGRHPTKADLDRVSTSHPIFIWHVSGHLAVCNTQCLERVGISADTQDPEDGVIRRMPGSNEPNGVLEESPVMQIMFGHLPLHDMEQRYAWLDGTQDYFASHGITTVQDGATGPGDLALFQRAAEQNKLRVDVVAYPIVTLYPSVADQYPYSLSYDNGFRVGGVKLLLDGSPQGKTAWLTEPYHVPPEGRDENYRGYGLLSDEALQEYLETYFASEVPVIAHANGDAASDQLIRSVETVRGKLGDADRRTVVIHAQTMRRDQVAQLVQNSMMPSYFAAHTFYWGDWHRDSVLGPERGSRISPIASTVELGVPYTIHNDSPVVPPDMMLLLWCAVNRITRSGQVLGAAERVSAEEALKAITINAAYQYFEEAEKGSLEPGKLADMVILSHDPTKVDPMIIKDIQVLETIKAGETIYRADGW